MKWLKRINSAISRTESIILVVLVLLMIGLSFSQIILRNFFSGGLTWADSCLRNMVLWVGFIGASLATQHHRHITVELTKFLSPKWKAIFEIFTGFVACGVGIVFIWASAGFVKSEYQAGSIAFLGIPFWVLELIIPIGFGFISLRFFLKAIEDIGGSTKGSSTRAS